MTTILNDLDQPQAADIMPGSYTAIRYVWALIGGKKVTWVIPDMELNGLELHYVLFGWPKPKGEQHGNVN